MKTKEDIHKISFESLEIEERKNIPLNEQKEEIRPHPIKRRSKKIIVLSVISLVLLATLGVFAVGYLKFNWFQKEQNNVVKINNEEFTVSYYTETKKVKTTFKKRKGDLQKAEEDNYITDFMVAILSKERLTYLGTKDYKYTAALALIRRKKIVGLKEYIEDLMDLSKEEIKKALKEDPSKVNHPFGKFTFYENGTLGEIYIPEDLDIKDATAIPELIEKVIPKLSKEVYDQGQKEGIEFRKNFPEEGIAVLTETQEMAKYKDKYLEEEVKDGKFKSFTQTTIKDSKVSSIKTTGELEIDQDIAEDEISLGLDDLKIEIESEINLKGSEGNREIPLFINGIEETTNCLQHKEVIKKKSTEDLVKLQEEQNKKEEEEEKALNEGEGPTIRHHNRNLISNANAFKKSISKYLALKTIKAPSKTISVGIDVSNTDSGTKVGLTVSYDSYKITVISTGVLTRKTMNSLKDKSEPQLTLFTAPFTVCGVPMKFELKLLPKLSFKITDGTASGYVTVTFKPSVSLVASIGPDAKIVYANAYISGELMSADLSVTVQHQSSNKRFLISATFTLSAGTLTVGVEAGYKILGYKGSVKYEVWKRDGATWNGLSVSGYVKY